MTGNLNPFTPAQAFPVPVDGNDPDIPDDMMKLAKKIEKRVMGVYANPGQRDTLTVSAGLEVGMFAFTISPEQVWYFNGSAWVAWPPPQVSITNGASVPSNAVGNEGDVYFQV